jgi:hypothetical protein
MGLRIDRSVIKSTGRPTDPSRDSAAHSFQSQITAKAERSKVPSQTVKIHISMRFRQNLQNYTDAGRLDEIQTEKR